MKRLIFLLLAFTLALPLAGFADDSNTPPAASDCGGDRNGDEEETTNPPAGDTTGTDVTEQ